MPEEMKELDVLCRVFFMSCNLLKLVFFFLERDLEELCRAQEKRVDSELPSVCGLSFKAGIQKPVC